MRIPITKDGWPLILGVPAGGAAAGLIALGIGSDAAAYALWTLGFIGGLFMAFFFRDPERHSPPDSDALLAGADGLVRSVERIRDERFFRGEAVRVSVFLSPFNVHINRSPAAGRVRHLSYTPGRRLLTLDNRASEVNEHSTIFIEGPLGPCLVRQIVGPVVRRVVYWQEAGQRVEKGQRLGMMKFGSRMDVYFPAADVEATVRRGDQVRAGETVIARLKKAGA